MTQDGQATGANVTPKTARVVNHWNSTMAELRQNLNEYWESILESIGDGFSVLDGEWRYTYLNNRQAGLLKVAKKEVLGKRIWELFPAARGTEVETQFYRAVTEQMPVHFEYFCPMWQRWFEWRVYPSVQGVSVLTMDIHERKQAEVALQEQQQFVQQLAEMSPGLLYLYDVVEQKNLYINTRSLELLGYSSETILAMEPDFLTQVMHPDDLAQMPAHFARLNETPAGSSLEIEYRMRHANGEWRWFISRDTVFSRTFTGQIRQILGTAQDITERKQTEEALREREQHLKIALKTAKLGSWQYDLMTGELSGSEQCKANFGLPADAEFSHATLFTALHPEDCDRVQAAIQRSLEKRTDYEVEERCFWPDGSLHWLIARGRLIYDSEDTPVRMVGVTLDITERKQFEESLKAANQRISNILESITDAFVAFDTQWRYTYVNQEAARLLRREPKELLGRRWQEVFPDVSPLNSQISQAMYRALEEQITVKLESFSQTTQCWLEVAIFPFSDGLALHFRDITDRKQKEQRQAAQYAVTRVLAEATTVVDAVPAILQSLCESLGWQLGIIWSVERDILRYVNSWQAPTINVQEFMQVTRQITFAPGVGLPGRIWASRQPQWMPEIREDSNFSRAASAVKGGLHTGFGFPILLGNEQLGVVECFSDRIQHPNEDLLELMAAIGSQIGQFMERKRTEAALREQEQRYRYIFEMAGVSIWEQDFSQVKATLEQLKAQGVQDFRQHFAAHPDFIQQAVGMVRIVNVNAATVQLFGATHKDELLASLHQIFLPETLEVFAEELLAIADGKTFFESETLLQTLQGECLNVIFTMAFPPPTAKFDNVLVSVMNITERKRTEAKIAVLNQDLQNRVHELQTLFEVIPIGILISDDPEFKQIRANPAFAQILGIAQDSNASWTPPAGNPRPSYKVLQNGREITPDETPLRYAAIHGVAVERAEVDILRSDGKLFNLFGYAAPLFDSQGKVRGSLGAFLDITQRKQAEVEREELLERERIAREAAEAANRIKDEFLAVLSHELRSPLNPILGWTQLLRTRKFDAQATERALETIERNAKLQTQLIDDLLDVSRILRGKMALNVAPINLATIIEAALETVRLSAEAKGIEICQVLPTNIGQVAGDSSRLQQIVWNLLSNAVKFTPAGGRVEVRLEELQMEENNVQSAISYAQITITDTGKGISSEFLPHVFDYFRQEDSKTTRQFGGLGLGLAIARHLIELHGGTIEADSPGEGLGATFTVKLPITITISQTSPDHSSCIETSKLNQLRILVVDDEADMRELLMTILEDSQAEVKVAASAAEALSVLDQFQPNVLVSDIGMPEVDGYMLLRQVRSRTLEQGGQIPAIALTAYAGEYNQQQALAAGFQLHLPKPVEPAQLVEAILSLGKNSE